MDEWWSDLSHDNKTVIIVFGIVAVAAVAVMVLIVVHDALLKAGI